MSRSGHSFQAILASVLALGLLVLLGGCGKNTNPPAYVADVVAYGEGYQAFVCYFVLADSLGQETSHEGTVTIRVYQEEWTLEGDKRDLLYSTMFTVSPEHFKKATLGMGAFEHKRLICPLGRIPYSHFWQQPTTMSGFVEIEFETNDGSTLTGRTSLIFDQE